MRVVMHCKDNIDWNEEWDCWNDIDHGAGGKGLSASSEDSGSLQRFSPSSPSPQPEASWLSECVTAVSPTCDLMAIGYKNRLAILSRRWENLSEEKEGMKLITTWRGTVGYAPGDEISAVLCLPLISQKQSSTGGPDWTCIIVGFTSGYVAMYTEVSGLGNMPGATFTGAPIDDALSTDPEHRGCAEGVPGRGSREGGAGVAPGAVCCRKPVCCRKRKKHCIVRRVYPAECPALLVRMDKLGLVPHASSTNTLLSSPSSPTCSSLLRPPTRRVYPAECPFLPRTPRQHGQASPRAARQQHEHSPLFFSKHLSDGLKLAHGPPVLEARKIYIFTLKWNGLVLLSQQFEEEVVLSLTCRTHPAGSPLVVAQDGAEELVMLYPRSITTIDGFSLFQTLRGNVEYADVVFIYGFCNGSANAAVQEYRRRYLTEKCPMFEHFTGYFNTFVTRIFPWNGCNS
ncbi:Rab3 GTPase-activating protein non-catalytic subunit [Chionoecetes opilio]|uniref:Rab3 GTPase-activating protein non-catalytic subunit n=1 Tax=Chionoecetes opilio TaxID=41210 RepID=A0A8J5CH40_CHIOP|nr:Rab3 GTPase-activating protein non-catalytic subunit [Chionoecetes opilio]